MDPAWQIRPERPEDAQAVDDLNDTCFGPGRFAKSAYRLREGVRPQEGLSFVAIEDGALVGSMRFWPIMVGGSKCLLLGPLAVNPEKRGRGIGFDLMAKGIDEAKVSDFCAILLVGDEPYYARAGFTRLPPGRVRFPGPVDGTRVLGLSLQQGALLTLSGELRRARIDDPVCADGAGVG